MSFPPLRCIKNWRQEGDLQHIVPVLQDVSHWEVLWTKEKQQMFVKHVMRSRWGESLLELPSGWTYVLAKHVVCVAYDHFVEPNWCYSVDTLEDEEGRLFRPVQMETQLKTRHSPLRNIWFLMLTSSRQTHWMWLCMSSCPEKSSDKTRHWSGNMDPGPNMEDQREAAGWHDFRMLILIYV